MNMQNNLRYTGRKECYYFILFLFYFLYLCFYLFLSSITVLILAYRLCVTQPKQNQVVLPEAWQITVWTAECAYGYFDYTIYGVDSFVYKIFIVEENRVILVNKIAKYPTLVCLCQSKENLNAILRSD